MIKRSILSILTILIFSTTAVSAATLNFFGTGQTHLVTRNDVSNQFNTTIDIITGDQKTTQNGLFLELASGPAAVTYTYLGAEAGNSNFSASMDGQMFNNRGSDVSVVGEQITTIQQTSGLLNFAFGTFAPVNAIGKFLNNALAYPASPEFAMGFARIDANSFFVLFDDIASGDRDFDDLVMRIDVAPVPLPAGALLLLSALAGAFMMQRRSQIA